IGSFPVHFDWSVSSESFKVEGGWTEHGKGETIWDRFSHEGHVFENQTTDLACDSYHKVDYDVYLLRGMMAPNYQFSISWARIFSTGRKESLIEKAVHLDEIYIQRFTVQSLMDGFEGPQGYSQRFGLHYVDFEDPDRPRTPKASAYYYSKVIERNGFRSAHLYFDIMRNNGFPLPTEEEMLYGHFPEGFIWSTATAAYQVQSILTNTLYFDSPA
uniref:Lactase n=1 Tax=Sinocyclocheilus grahami TaxID=75366 RepID=A0A672K214_SINGR